MTTGTARQPGTRAQRGGFTLLELLLVVIIVGVLSTIAMVSLVGGAEAERLRESGRRISALVAMCRAEAMNQARQYRVAVRRDGTLEVARQVDPITAPQEFEVVRSEWANLEYTLPDVWVEAVQALPDGPQPIDVSDDQLEFFESDESPVALADLEAQPKIMFDGTGSCTSVRLVLRDKAGRGQLLTLDGRLGRVTIVDADAADPEELQRPTADSVEFEESTMTVPERPAPR